MRPLLADQIRGIWATLLLPISANEDIDYLRFQDQLTHLAHSGIDGVYTNGTAGEFYNQTESEFDHISALTAEICERHSLPFQLGCSHMSPVISLERLQRVVSLKPSAIQVILPDWMWLTFAEMCSYLEKMAASAAPIGLVLYNPPHAKQVLSPKQWQELLASGIPLVGCKVAGGDALWYEEMQPVLERMSVFVPGHRLATGMSRGAHGSYSNVACLNPRAAADWYQLMLRDIQRALTIEKRVLGFFEEAILPFITIHGYSNTAVDKLLAAAGGWTAIGTRVRWPYHSIPENAVTSVRDLAAKWIPEFITKDN
ncbi:MAG: dihydrodipicolinate synthase family protein [Lunatimonas sp.]|uniref:dihydrodipicolinate synthase family protein n=1 Tax=Lunatimonas sp. TaxID=2060141 RepID=UPI00263B19D9|nr:dihydrodipicolinate synthase family protein [Lunatimonas sp.]MCC5938321.1 dihydrodipicolinate synthase family protein [Lunatimonas sp.]